MRMVGIAGKMGVGKTSLAKELCALLGTHRRVSFADALKTEVALRYEIPLDWCYHDAGKNAMVYPRDEVISGNMTVRKLLQDYGNAMRQRDKNHWVRELDAYLKRKDDVIIDDVRFTNEAQYVLDNGGLLVRLDPYDGWQERQHSDDVSELELDNYDKFTVRYKPGFGMLKDIAKDILEKYWSAS